MSRELPSGEVTQLLLRWRAGDEAALASLVPLVYEDLRSLGAAPPEPRKTQVGHRAGLAAARTHDR